MKSHEDDGAVEKKKKPTTKTTVFVVANLFFYFYFSISKTELLLLTDVGWIGCRMDSLPASLLVWMAVLPDAGPAYLLLPDRRGVSRRAWMAGKLTQTGVPTGTMSV